MLHFVIGTKAQFIKMAPLMWLLQDAGKPYHLVDLSQHGALTGSTLDDFGLAPATTRFGDNTTLVKTYGQAARWSLGVLAQVARRPATVRARWFRGQDGVALVHGDTLSTLLGTLLARRAGLPVALVEAGLTSGRLLDPFPEEGIRRLVQRMAADCFCPGSREYAHLASLQLRARLHDTGYNTGRDALSLALQLPARMDFGGDYGVATTHRLETLASRHRLAQTVQHVIALAQRLGRVHFFVHPPTRNALRRHGLDGVLQAAPGVTCHDLLTYVDFAHVLAGARFILTDGGSVQEEAAALGKPCIVMRDVTERHDGLDSNARLTSWQADADAAFLRGASGRASISAKGAPLAASQRILDALSPAAGERAQRASERNSAS